MTLIHGIDSTNKVIPLLLDASGNVIISASELTTTGGKIKLNSSGSVTIVADEPSFINPVGVFTNYSNLTLPAGSSTQKIFTIPSSQRHILTGLFVRYVGTVAGLIMYPIVSNGSNSFVLEQVNPVVNAKYYTYFPDMTLEAGWSIGCVMTGATLNDDFNGVAMTRRIK